MPRVHALDGRPFVAPPRGEASRPPVAWRLLSSRAITGGTGSAPRSEIGGPSKEAAHGREAQCGPTGHRIARHGLAGGILVISGRRADQGTPSRGQRPRIFGAAYGGGRADRIRRVPSKARGCHDREPTRAPFRRRLAPRRSGHVFPGRSLSAGGLSARPAGTLVSNSGDLVRSPNRTIHGSHPGKKGRRGADGERRARDAD